MGERICRRSCWRRFWRRLGRFSQASATVRLVCAGWKAVHDALVTRLVLRRQTTDEAVGMLLRCFVGGLAGVHGRHLGTDEGLRAVSSLRALTSLSILGLRRVLR